MITLGTEMESSVGGGEGMLTSVSDEVRGGLSSAPPCLAELSATLSSNSFFFFPSSHQTTVFTKILMRVRSLPGSHCSSSTTEC